MKKVAHIHHVSTVNSRASMADAFHNHKFVTELMTVRITLLQMKHTNAVHRTRPAQQITLNARKLTSVSSHIGFVMVRKELQ